MGKLHQILAVEDSAMTRFKAVVEEGKSTFSGKDNLFKGVTTRQQSMLQESDPKYREFPDATESVPVATTVDEKLEYIFEAASQYFDLVAQKDEANTSARADLIVDGQTLLTGVPAVTLLFIENKFKVVRDLLTSIKTLDQAKNWSDAKVRPGVFQAPETSRVVKEAVEEYKIVAQATDKHPAQVAKVIEQQIRATRYTTELSGLISTFKLSNYLTRCDKLINAAKQARQTANDQNVPDVHIANKLFKYLLG